jgi:hypothetical protein
MQILSHLHGNGAPFDQAIGELLALIKLWPDITGFF